MPTVEHIVPDVSPKALTRRMGRSAAIWSAKRASFMGFAVPKIERTIRTLHDSLVALSKPITVVVGQGDKAYEVEIVDYASQAKISNALLAAIESERQLLGFPSPGRRRDESEREKSANSQPGIVEIVESAPISSAKDIATQGNVHAGASDVGQAVSMVSESVNEKSA